MRECGLKCYLGGGYPGKVMVTPLAGVWIEIYRLIDICEILRVTPLAGVWIEIGQKRRCR